jgi:hypothetical protein
MLGCGYGMRPPTYPVQKRVAALWHHAHAELVLAVMLLAAAGWKLLLVALHVCSTSWLERLLS